MSKLTVTSPAFAAGAPIPSRHAYRGEGKNLSPALAWRGVPAGARELALLCDDPDAPRPQPWVHWIAYGLPADLVGLSEGAGATGEDLRGTPGHQGLNSWDELGWGGPLPPRGHGTHHYHFQLYALDAPLELRPGATKDELLGALAGHVLAQGELVGTYER